MLPWVLTQYYYCVMIPAFESSGNLPPGIHWSVWSEMAVRFGTNSHRLLLLQGMESAIDSLRSARCQAVFIDGSFVSNKTLPSDYDGCWDINGVQIQLLDPVLLDFSPGRICQKLKYKGELFPAQMNANSSGRVFLDFFMTDKYTGMPKGIVGLRLR
jgi:hypothetical protein